MKTRNVIPISLLIAALAVAGCSGAATPAATETPAPPPTSPPAVVATDTPPPVPTATTAVEPTAEPTATAEPTPTAAASPIEEPTATEPAAETSPSEKLAAAFPSSPTAAGEVILVTGRVLDTNGDPIPGAAVEFWQTDSNGIYDHPGDSGTANRDPGFQFYGTAIAAEDGTYAFRTVRPGYYEPRPKHIHVKVRLDGRELLTTQFYFEEDRADLGSEGVFAQAGGLGDMLILKEAGNMDVNGVLTTLLTNDLVIDTGSGGALTPTPAQTEGPYYPVVRVADFDNDLAAVP